MEGRAEIAEREGRGLKRRVDELIDEKAEMSSLKLSVMQMLERSTRAETERDGFQARSDDDDFAIALSCDLFFSCQHQPSNQTCEGILENRILMLEGASRGSSHRGSLKKIVFLARWG